MPVRRWRVSRCFHIVPLGLPTAVAHMGKQARRWDKPITPPSLGGLLPVHHAAAPGPSPPGLVPHESLLEFPEMRISGLKSLQRGYILLGNLTWWPPWDNTEGGDVKLGFCGMKQVCGKLDFWPTFIKIICFATFNRVL